MADLIPFLGPVIVLMICIYMANEVFDWQIEARIAIGIATVFLVIGTGFSAVAKHLIRFAARRMN